MAKYKLQENGVLDTETGANIPDDTANRHWVEFGNWLATGNVADPMDIVDLWIAGRANRDAKLSASDWTQLTDSPLIVTKQSEWSTYRQELRNLPATYADYSTVVWPTEPAA